MSQHVFVKGVALKDGDVIFDCKNNTILVEVVDEAGNCSEVFVPPAFVNIQIESLEGSAKENVEKSSTDTSQSFNESNLLDEKNAQRKDCSEVEDHVDSSKVCEERDKNDSSNDSDTYDSEKDHEENTPPNNSSLPCWSTGQSKRLLHLYNKYLPKVGPMKKFKTKKQMFDKIAIVINEEFYIQVNGDQCSNRHKRIIRQYKADQRVNRTSGASRVDLEFEEEIEALKAADDSLQPEVRMGVGKIEHIKKKFKLDNKSEETEKVDGKQGVSPPTAANATPSTSASGSSQGKKPQSIADTLLLISEKKEQKRDQRHKEKLELLRALFNAKTDG